jgi:uncharacterized membrane protein YbhN (UPF0104 family)
MKRKHAITTAVVVAILAILVYVQFRTWRTFDWAEFWRQTRGVNLWSIAAAVALIYVAYVLRAVRWMLFLRPTKHTTIARMIPPQFIGFTALGLFGRAGEFARPYIVARKEGLSFPSQLAVWAVERVFDMATVAVIVASFLGFRHGRASQILREGVHNGFHSMLHKAHSQRLVVLAGLLLAAAAIYGLWKLSQKSSGALSERLRSFREGLHTIKDFKSLVAIILVSIGIWAAIAQAYLCVVHAYPQVTVTVPSEDEDGTVVTETIRLNQMKADDVMLMMCASMFGSMVQLPGVGGGSQLAVITVLSKVFGDEPYNVTPELAVSCGMMLWLVTFMAVIPAGIIMARYEHISLRAVAQESETEAEAEKSPGGAPVAGPEPKA